MEGRCFGVFIVLLIKLVLGECAESNEEESKEVLGEEYGQIFHSLPTLFEYLLEILHERPGILEKDDVTFFQDVTQETCEGDEKKKREVDEQCKIQAKSFIGKDNLDVFKRNIVTNDIIKDIHTNVVNDDTMGEIITTLPKTQLISGNGLNDKSATKNKSKLKTDKIQSSKNHEESNNKIKSDSKINTKSAKDTIKVKKNVNFDDSFLGAIDWSKFYLTPDEVEEQALKTERAIEEHNKNKKTRVD